MKHWGQEKWVAAFDEAIQAYRESDNDSARESAIEKLRELGISRGDAHYLAHKHTKRRV